MFQLNFIATKKLFILLLSAIMFGPVVNSNAQNIDLGCVGIEFYELGAGFFTPPINPDSLPAGDSALLVWQYWNYGDTIWMPPGSTVKFEFTIDGVYSEVNILFSNDGIDLMPANKLIYSSPYMALTIPISSSFEACVKTVFPGDGNFFNDEICMSCKTVGGTVIINEKQNQDLLISYLYFNEGKLNVSFSNKQNISRLQLKIMDITGRVIDSREMDTNGSKRINRAISLPYLSKGIYLLSVQSDTNVT